MRHETRALSSALDTEKWKKRTVRHEYIHMGRDIVFVKLPYRNISMVHYYGFCVPTMLEINLNFTRLYFISSVRT